MNFSNFIIDKLTETDSSFSVNGKKTSSNPFLFADIIKVCEQENAVPKNVFLGSAFLEQSQEIFSSNDSIVTVSEQDFASLLSQLSSIINSEKDIQPTQTNHKVEEADITKFQFVLTEDKLLELADNFEEQTGRSILPLTNTHKTSINEKELTVAFKQGSNKISISVSPIRTDENYTNKVIENEHNFVSKLLVDERLISHSSFEEGDKITNQNIEANVNAFIETEKENYLPEKIFYKAEIIKIESSLKTVGSLYNHYSQNNLISHETERTPVNSNSDESKKYNDDVYTKKSNVEAVKQSMNGFVEMFAAKNSVEKDPFSSHEMQESINTKNVLSSDYSKINAELKSKSNLADVLAANNNSESITIKNDNPLFEQSKRTLDINSLMNGLTEEEKSVFKKTNTNGEIKELSFTKTHTSQTENQTAHKDPNNIPVNKENVHVITNNVFEKNIYATDLAFSTTPEESSALSNTVEKNNGKTVASLNTEELISNSKPIIDTAIKENSKSVLANNNTNSVKTEVANKTEYKVIEKDTTATEILLSTSKELGSSIKNNSESINSKTVAPVNDENYTGNSNPIINTAIKESRKNITTDKNASTDFQSAIVTNEFQKKNKTLETNEKKSILGGKQDYISFSTKVIDKPTTKETSLDANMHVNKLQANKSVSANAANITEQQNNKDINYTASVNLQNAQTQNSKEDAFEVFLANKLYLKTNSKANIKIENGIQPNISASENKLNSGVENTVLEEAKVNANSVPQETTSELIKNKVSKDVVENLLNNHLSFGKKNVNYDLKHANVNVADLQNEIKNTNSNNIDSSKSIISADVNSNKDAIQDNRNVANDLKNVKKPDNTLLNEIKNVYSETLESKKNNLGNTTFVETEKTISVKDNSIFNKNNAEAKDQINTQQKDVSKSSESNLYSNGDKDGGKSNQSESFKTHLNQVSSIDKSFDVENVKIQSEVKPSHESFKTIKQQEILPELSKLIMHGEKQTMTLQLTPENLGKVKLTVDMVENQIVTKIEVENEQVKQFVQSNLEQLKQNMQSAGITLTNVNVSLSDEQKNQKLFSQKKKSSSRDDKAEIVDEVSQLTSKKKFGYNTYEFTA